MNISPVSQRIQVVNAQASKMNNVSFTGVPKIKPSMFSRSNAFLTNVNKKWQYLKNVFYEDVMAKKLIAPTINSMGKVIDSVGNIENMAAHTSTLGAIVTTSVYANRTLRNKEFEKKNARTLALNQIMVTGVSTICGYTVNNSLDKFSKKLGYKFRELNQGTPKLNVRMAGFNFAKQLLIFTVMNRYVAPVIVTPIASKLGKIFDKDNKLTPEEKAGMNTFAQAQTAADLLKIYETRSVKSNNLK